MEKSSLLPRLPCAKKARQKHDISAGFRDGDLLHLLTPLFGYPAGTVLPVLGSCLCEDLPGNAYALRAYVPGKTTTLADREAKRFPVVLQTEEFFGASPLFLTEIDITDHADALVLERVQEAVIIPMYPKREHALRISS